MKNSNTIHLTEKEREIMNLIWELGHCSVRKLLEHLPEPKPHFNTVSTFVRILEQKGLVGRREGDGRGSEFYAILPRQKYRKSTLNDIVNKLFGSSFAMVSMLVDDNNLTAEQLEELLELARNKKQPQ